MKFFYKTDDSYYVNNRVPNGAWVLEMDTESFSVLKKDDKKIKLYTKWTGGDRPRDTFSFKINGSELYILHEQDSGLALSRNMISAYFACTKSK